jgi:molybdopterin synthase catalytic subunit
MQAEIHIQLLSAPIEPKKLQLLRTREEAGCTVEFRGVVRGEEGGKPITGLDYECFEKMARHQFDLLCRETTRRWPLLSLEVFHSVGFVPVGATSFYLRIGARHRQEAIAAMDYFINEMKQRVPIWKHPRHHESPPPESNPTA